MFAQDCVLFVPMPYLLTGRTLLERQRNANIIKTLAKGDSGGGLTRQFTSRRISPSVCVKLESTRLISEARVSWPYLFPGH
jgi:hypothetical protein